MMTIIHLHGELAHKFGRIWKLDVTTPAEALKAIEANRPGLAAYLGGAEERGIRFKIRVGKDQLKDPEMVNFTSRGRHIHITPVVFAAKSKWLGLIIGVVLVALTWGAGAGYLGATLGNASLASFFGSATLTWGSVIGGMGIGLALGGVAQLLTKTPSLDGYKGTESFLFNGPANVHNQGGPVPICYGGPIVVGATRISAGIRSEDRAGSLATPSGGYTGAGGYGGSGNKGEGSFSRYPFYDNA